jgi:LPS-assembly lipoprotein
MWWPSAQPARPCADAESRRGRLRGLGMRDRWRGNGPASAFARLAAVLMLALFTAGCFEPLYGERTLVGGPNLRERLRGVKVVPIPAVNGSPEARLAVELRNVLLYEMTGGEGSVNPTHQLNIQLTSTRQRVILDITTALPDVELYGINATYTLTEIATGKPVVTAQTFARVTYDNPGLAQRFARARGQRDAEDRAARVIAENIRSRLASYFAAGT